MTGLAEIAARILAARKPIAMIAGAGTSHSAGVPTGGDVLREIARRRGEDAGDDPVAWYQQSVGIFPDYFGMVGDGTDILPDAVFDRRTPTPAHRSIARLAAAGVLGPILTPNLDRLLDQALHEAGITAEPAYTLDALAEVSLDGVVLLKLHGDFRDIGIRHTALGEHIYHGVIDDLLDRVFAGFDLLVAGWSASWDVPLTRALCRAGRGRIWWLQCGPPSAVARQIFAARRPVIAPVAGSDEGLSELTALLLDTAPAVR
jgi:hypothetical protein